MKETGSNVFHKKFLSSAKLTLVIHLGLTRVLLFYRVRTSQVVEELEEIREMTRIKRRNMSRLFLHVLVKKGGGRKAQMLL
jgi:hypothetical protein